MKDLRSVVVDAYGPLCEWPGCGRPFEELAHLTSRGMGGSKTRDEVGNVMLACWLHARITDGEGANRVAQVHPVAETVEMFRRVGYEYPNDPNRLAYHRAEALRRYLAETRPFTIEGMTA